MYSQFLEKSTVIPDFRGVAEIYLHLTTFTIIKIHTKKKEDGEKVTGHLGKILHLSHQPKTHQYLCISAGYRMNFGMHNWN